MAGGSSFVGINSVKLGTSVRKIMDDKENIIPFRVVLNDSEKGLGRTIAGAARPNKPGYDGDGDGFIVNPATGRDDVPFRGADRDIDPRVLESFKPKQPKPTEDKPRPSKVELKPKPEKATERYDDYETEEIFREYDKQATTINKLRKFFDREIPMSKLPGFLQQGSGETNESYRKGLRDWYTNLLNNRQQMNAALKKRGYDDPEKARLEYNKSKRGTKSLMDETVIPSVVKMQRDDEDAELSPRQRIMYEFFELIAKKMGKWEQDSGPEGAHYVEEHPFGDKGMKCINCSFFQGGNRCEVVTGEIKPEAICKLWVIRKDLVKE